MGASAGLGIWHVRVSAAACVVGWGLMGVFWKQLPPEIPLWYSRPWGDAQLAHPGNMFVVTLLNLLAAVCVGVGHNLLMKRDQVMAGVVAASGIVIQILGVLALIRILLLVL